MFMNTLARLLDQYTDTKRAVTISELQLTVILEALDAEGYEPVAGASPAFATTDTFIAGQSTNFVDSELAKHKDQPHIVGPYALLSEDGSTHYHPRGRMIYVQKTES